MSGTGTTPSIIPLCEPVLRGNEWAYIKECLDTNWVSSVGVFVDRFEREVAAHVGTKCAVATINGTAALHVALLVAGVQPGDEVLTSTLTFVAPANAIRYVGAHPVFMDADPVYWQMDVEKVSEFLSKECRWGRRGLENATTGRRVKAIVPVDILGHPADMDAIMEVARRFELVVVEDATEALGARYKGEAVGRKADIACLSFNGNKIITTGGGGMIVTDHEGWSQKARHLTTQAKADPVEYIHDEIGFNYRLTNVQAAMGCAQLEQLGGFIQAKREIARNYACLLASLPGVSPMKESPWATSTFWMYTVTLPGAVEIDRRAVSAYMRRQGIQTRPLWQPLHRTPAHRGSQAYRCEIAEELYERAISLPCSASLEQDAQRRVVTSLAEAIAPVHSSG